MFTDNKELHRSLWLILLISGGCTAIGFTRSPACGLLVLTACILLACVYFVTESFRYKQLQRLSRHLDDLLLYGTPLPIQTYQEGELSILASQIQKMTLRLTESAEVSRNDKRYLADSLADISHQLRTPLTAMNLTVAMLRTPELSNRRRMELSRELSSLLSRMDWLVETLLKFSKLDAGTVQMAQDRIPVRTLLTQAAAPLAIAMDLRNQTLTVHCKDETLKGDFTWTAEALGNILKNCTEHTPDGGTITITARETPLYTQITVEDTGPGFSPGDIPHLFERFYKGSNASESSYGIGLALARTIILSQNGTIQASNGNPGAVFTIKFYKQII